MLSGHEGEGNRVRKRHATPGSYTNTLSNDFTLSANFRASFLRSVSRFLRFHWMAGSLSSPGMPNTSASASNAVNATSRSRSSGASDAMLSAVGFSLVKLMKGLKKRWLKRLFLCLRTMVGNLADAVAGLTHWVEVAWRQAATVLRRPLFAANWHFA